MLKRLTIRNFALIDDLSIEFGPGLNVLTGETGAGKTIIIEALSAALGDRVRPDSIRAGADSCTVTAELGGEAPHLCVREMRASGRTTARLDDAPASIAALRDLASSTVEFVAPGAQYDLFRASHSLRALDQWGGETVEAARRAYEEAYRRVRDMEHEIELLATDERERERRMASLEFEVNEIASAALVPDEEEALLARKQRLANAERLVEHAHAALAALGSMEDDGAPSAVRMAEADAGRLAELDPAAKPVAAAMADAAIRLDEAVSALRQYAEFIERDPAALEETVARLDLIAKLKRKYGDSIEEIERYRAECEEELKALGGASERRAELAAALGPERERRDRLAQALSEARARAARRIEKALPKELRTLGFLDTRFCVGIDEKEMDSTGRDAVTFYVALNPGEPLMPLDHVISMGEASRALLGLRAAFADAFDRPTIVFDEIDVGIGGETGHAVGEKLKELARDRQVVCITHLPQIAALADRHIAVTKRVVGGRAVVGAQVVSGRDRQVELSRMRGESNKRAVRADPRSGAT